MAYGLPDWLTGGSSSSKEQLASVREKSKDGGYVAPDRNARQMCYDSRDLFFDCLDKNGILDANKEDEKARKLCPKEVGEYERDCAKSWIKYFKEKRVQDYARDQTIAKIKEDDAKMVAKAKAERQGKGWFS